MRYLALYTAIIALTAISCSTNRSFTMEDDIYYVPGKKALMVKEVENLTGQEISSSIQTDTYPEEVSHAKGSSIAPAAFTQSKQQVINSQTGKLENVDMAALTTQAENMLANNEKINATIYENTGYWIGGFKGSENDLEEIQRIINLYPEGFASFNTNGYDIAMNLSFDPDWNVYTDNGRLWWFPSNSNIELYSSLLFGTYPKYIWTVIWNNPRFDSYAFDASFNRRGNWGFRFGWGSGGWHAGFGWNSGWYDPWYDPWYNWYGWYDPWYGPWYNPWFGYYPGWYNPHWHHHWDHPGWGGGHGSGNRPRPITGLRPSYSGGGTAGSIRPNRPSGGNTNAGSVRPGNIRPNTSASTRPNSSTVTRPGTNSSIRPNGTVTRPGSTTRPGVTITRPGNNSTTRPGTSVTRPGNNTTRPNGTVTRPGTTTRPATVTRPGTTTRPGTSVTRPSSRPNTSQYSRPASRTSSSSNVKNYSRPQSSYRPTYNNNSSSGYIPSRSSSSGSSYTPSRSSGSSGSRGSYIPSRSSGGGGGGGGGGAVHRPTRR